MANQRRRLFATACGLLAAGSLATAACGQDRPPPAPAPGGGQRPNPGLPVGPQAKVCYVVLGVGNSEGGHLLDGQRIRLIGPIPPDGSIIVSRATSNANPPPPPHQWRGGLFTASRVSPSAQVNPPWDYLLEVRVKGGDHEAEQSHQYLMTIETLDPQDGCPKRVTLYTADHPGDSGDDHPGHADAIR